MSKAKKSGAPKKLAVEDWEELYKQLEVLKVLPKGRPEYGPRFFTDSIAMFWQADSYESSEASKEAAFERVRQNFTSSRDKDNVITDPPFHWQDIIYFRLELAKQRQTIRLMWKFQTVTPPGRGPYNALRVEMWQLGKHLLKANAISPFDEEAIEEMDQIDAKEQLKTSLAGTAAEERPDLAKESTKKPGKRRPI